MARYDPARFPLSPLRLLPQPGRLAAPFHDYATYRYGRFACGWKATGQVIASARVLAKLKFSVEKKLRYSGLPGVDIDLYSRTLP